MNGTSFRRLALVEAVLNVTGGYGLGVVTQLLVYPRLGWAINLPLALKLGLVFSVGPLVWCYALRRVMQRYQRRRDLQALADQLLAIGPVAVNDQPDLEDGAGPWPGEGDDARDRLAANLRATVRRRTAK